LVLSNEGLGTEDSGRPIKETKRKAEVAKAPLTEEKNLGGGRKVKGKTSSKGKDRSRGRSGNQKWGEATRDRHF